MKQEILIPDRVTFEKAGIEDINAAILYIVALQLKISESSVKINHRDRKRLYTSKIIQIEVSEKENRVIISDNNNNVIFSHRSIPSEVDERVDEYRKLFEGLKRGSMGNRTLVRGNLIKFLEKNSDYTMEDVITAAKRYIGSFNQDYTLMRQADYFIYKQAFAQGPVLCTLLDVIEEPENYPISNQTVWTDVV